MTDSTKVSKLREILMRAQNVSPSTNSPTASIFRNIAEQAIKDLMVEMADRAIDDPKDMKRMYDEIGEL